MIGRGSGAAATAVVDVAGSLSCIISGDSSAEVAISNKCGCGKLRHINIGELWIQEKIAEQAIELRKVAGEKNPADMLTKHVNEVKRQRYCSTMQFHVKDGKATAGLSLQQGHVN